MKKVSSIRASHVNSGTSNKRQRSSSGAGREFRHPKLHVDVERSESTAYGGLALAASFMRSLSIASRLDNSLNILQSHRPYTESDHILTHVYNLFSGGDSIEDISNLQGSEPIRRILGASRIPDPTTAGDFLRRFDLDNLNAFNQVIDETHEKVWQQRYGRKKRDVALVDLDSHIHPVFGNQKEGADFTYKGSYGYHPLAITLAETQEVLRILNRPGNVTSSDGASVLLEEVFPLLNRNFKRVIVRGDSAFAQQDIYEACEENGQYFAIVNAGYSNLESLAESLSESEYRPFRTKNTKNSTKSSGTSRKRRANLRRKKARSRKKRDLKLQTQWVAEVDYQPASSDETYRLIIRRQKIEESKQGQLFTLYRYRFVISNLPESYSAEEIVNLAYQRCDQENIIEQLKNGVSAMRMPAGDFNANSAFIICARLAHNLKAWLAMLALPEEVMRWEWKRFRQAFVYMAARVIFKARQVFVRFADSHRFAEQVATGIARLQV